MKFLDEVAVVNNLLKNLKFISKKLFTPVEYEKFLRLAARFPTFNIYNLLLLYYQMPEATLIAGQNAWRDNYGLQVKSGERAICLIRPELNDDELLGYIQIGVFDVSQLTEMPDVKKEEFSITDFFYERTGNVVSYDRDGFLGEKDSELIDDELFVKYNENLSQEENEQNMYRQMLLYYVEHVYNDEGLLNSNIRDKAIIQGVEYILCCRYGIPPIKYNTVYLTNLKDRKIEDFLGPIVAISSAIIDEIENNEYVEFNFTDIAFVNMMEEAETREDYETIFDFEIEEDINKMIDDARASFDEKLSLLPDDRFVEIIEDRKNNKMMTQPPYKIKLIDGV